MKRMLFLLGLIFSTLSYGQSVVGKWKSVDDNSGKVRSIVEIYEQGGKYFGKILKLFPQPGEDPDPICDLCKGDRKNKKVLGLEIIRNMEKQRDGDFEDGTILDPENGKVYDCKLWVEDGKLKVRGYILFLYRTQTWLPLAG